MEKLLPNTIFSTRLKILHWGILSLYDILSYFLLCFQPLLNFVYAKQKSWTKIPNVSKEEEKLISKGDIKMVMTRLGINYDSDDDKLQENRYCESELSRLFEEEPSIDEVKEAFDTFDENKDGFIDAKELQRVLHCLGLKEESQMEKCRRMIKAVKKDGDGKIEFNDFVMLMEQCFC